MARRESDKAAEKAPERAMDGLLRHTLQNAAPPSDRCPSPDILAAYFEGSLDDRETADFELHFSRCAVCRDRQAAMSRAHAPARAIEDAEPRWSWLWDWRWLAPAMAVLVVALVWYARRPEITPAKNPQLAYVARSQPAEPQVTESAPPVSEDDVQPTTATPSQSSGGAPSKAEQQHSGSGRAQLQPSQQKENPADRKAADEFASNVETDALKKDSAPVSRDAIAPKTASGEAPLAATGAGGVIAGAVGGAGNGTAHRATPAAAPTPSPASPQVQVAVSEAANASPAPVNTRQLATSALTSRAANLTVERRAIETLVRTPNPQVVWRIGSVGPTGGFVERSIDGGATWIGQLPGSGGQLTAGSAPAEMICWLVGRNGMILLTTDAVEWRTIPPPTKTDFVRVAAKDALEATVTTADGRKFTTKDGGANWQAEP